MLEFELALLAQLGVLTVDGTIDASLARVADRGDGDRTHDRSGEQQTNDCLRTDLLRPLPLAVTVCCCD